MLGGDPAERAALNLSSPWPVEFWPCVTRTVSECCLANSSSTPIRATLSGCSGFWVFQCSIATGPLSFGAGAPPPPPAPPGPTAPQAAPRPAAPAAAADTTARRETPRCAAQLATSTAISSLPPGAECEPQYHYVSVGARLSTTQKLGGAIAAMTTAGSAPRFTAQWGCEASMVIASPASRTNSSPRTQ